MSIQIISRDSLRDRHHKKMRLAIEKRERAYLWVPADAITFVPRLLPKIYGDDTAGPDFAEMTDQILTDLESAFGDGCCGYSGSSLFMPKRLRSCRCEDCKEMPIARWPMVDGVGGCSWSRMDWPKGFCVVENPVSHTGNLLATETASNE